MVFKLPFFQFRIQTLEEVLNERTPVLCFFFLFFSFFNLLRDGKKRLKKTPVHWF